MAAPGTILDGKYVVERVLGEGGMGMVVAAVHRELGHRVAIKMMLPHAAEHPEMLSRFEREARAAAGLSSEHAARVTDVGRFDNGMPFMVMEFLEGEDLEQAIRRQKQLPIAEAVRYFIQACIGLHDAHTHGIVHRDVKPSNIFLARRPSGRVVVKILDFGIAKATLAQESHSLTRTSTVMGSPQYMSPEQLADTKSVDLRTDIWSLGAAFYEAVTGTQAFPAETLAQLHVKIITESPVRPTALRRECPPELEMALLNCLEKAPGQRYASMAALQRDLERVEMRLSSQAPLFDSSPELMRTELPSSPDLGALAGTRAPEPAATADALSGTGLPTSKTFHDAPPASRSKSRVLPFALAGAAVLAGGVLLMRTRTVAPPFVPAAVVEAPAVPRIEAPPRAAEEAPSVPALEVPREATMRKTDARDASHAPTAAPAVVAPVHAPRPAVPVATGAPPAGTRAQAAGSVAPVRAPIEAEKPKKKRSSLDPEVEE